MSSNQDPTKLNFFQKRKVVTELDERLSYHKQDITENEVDATVKNDALDGIDRFAHLIFNVYFSVSVTQKTA